MGNQPALSILDFPLLSAGCVIAHSRAWPLFLIKNLPSGGGHEGYSPEVAPAVLLWSCPYQHQRPC